VRRFRCFRRAYLHAKIKKSANESPPSAFLRVFLGKSVKNGRLRASKNLLAKIASLKRRADGIKQLFRPKILLDGCVAMKCPDVQDRLSAYYDGELSAESQAKMTRHLAGCESCAAEFAEFRDVTRAVSRMREPEAPSSVWDGLSAELANAELNDSSEPQPASAQRPRQRRDSITISRGWRVLNGARAPPL